MTTINYCQELGHADNLCNIVCADTGKRMCGLCLVQMCNITNKINVATVDDYVAKSIDTCRQREKLIATKLAEKRLELDETLIKLNYEIKELEEKLVLVKNLVVNNNCDEIIRYVTGTTSGTQILNGDDVDRGIYIMNKSTALMKMVGSKYVVKKNQPILLFLHNGTISTKPHADNYFAIIPAEDKELEIETAFPNGENSPIVTIDGTVLKVTRNTTSKCSTIFQKLNECCLVTQTSDGKTNCGSMSASKNQGYVLFVEIEYRQWY
jgi:hypothetical protein